MLVSCMFGHGRVKKKISSLWESNLYHLHQRYMLCPLCQIDLGCGMSVNSSTDLFSHDKFINHGSIEINTGVFPGKMCSDWCKTMVGDERNQKPLALLIWRHDCPLNAANWSDINFYADRVCWSQSALGPIMSALRIDWFRSFLCYITSQVMIQLRSVSASQQNTNTIPRPIKKYHVETYKKLVYLGHFD